MTNFNVFNTIYIKAAFKNLKNLFIVKIHLNKLKI